MTSAVDRKGAATGMNNHFLLKNLHFLNNDAFH